MASVTTGFPCVPPLSQNSETGWLCNHFTFWDHFWDIETPAGLPLSAPRSIFAVNGVKQQLNQHRCLLFPCPVHAPCTGNGLVLPLGHMAVYFMSIQTLTYDYCHQWAPPCSIRTAAYCPASPCFVPHPTISPNRFVQLLSFRLWRRLVI